VNVLRSYRAILADGPLARLLAGEFVSSVGDWLYLVALLVVVYRESADPVLLGIVGAARVLPYVVLSVPAGIVADRFDRRLVLLVTDLARGAIMLGLAALVAGRGPLWAIVALSILATCFSSFFGPTIGAYLPTLVRDESQLGPANSAWASLDNLAFIVGPAIGGLLIAASGLELAFLLNAASFGVVAAVLWRLPGARAVGVVPAAEPDASGAESPVASADDRTMGAPDRASAPIPSFRAILLPVAAIGLIDVVAGFAFGGLGVLTVILASDVFGSGDEATGYLNAAIGVGGLLGAVGSGALVLRPRLGPPLIAGATLLGAGLIAVGAVRSLGPAMVAMAMTSGGSLLVEVVSATIFQRVVPDSMRGRALGLVATVATLAYAAGSFVIPVLAGGIGVWPVMTGSAIAVVAAALLALAIVGPAAGRMPVRDAATIRRVARLPIFAGVPPDRIERIMARGRVVPVGAGTVVMRQGEPAERFEVILEGAFDVTQAGTRSGETLRLRTMGPDEVFGEIGLLNRAARSATVTASTDGRLFELDGSDFLELVSAGAGLASRLLELHRGARPTADVSRT
jgi:MFS family permease